MTSDAIGIITTIYKDEELKEVTRLKKEFKLIGLKNYQFYVHDGRKENRGYAYGINQGIIKASKNNCKVLMIVNPDISVTSLSYQIIKDGLKKFDVLGFTIKQNNKTYYGGSIDKYRLSGGLIEESPKIHYQPVDFISGSLMIIKKSVLDKIGLLNENYFIYYEDVEFCLEARQAGFKVGIDSKSSYTHYEISNTNNPQKKKLLFWNRLRFFWKYSNTVQKLREGLRAPITFYEQLPILFNVVKHSPFAISFFSYNLSSILSKAVHFFIFIVLINNLSPAQYGIYTLVWAFVNLFTPFLDFGTTTYGLVYGDNRKLQNKTLYSMRFYFSVIVYLAISLGSFAMFHDPQTQFFVLLTATTVFASSFSGSYLIHNSLRQKIVISSYLSLTFNIVFSLLVIGAVLLKQGISYLFVSYALCYLSYSVLNSWLLKKELSLKAYPKKWLIILKQSLVFVAIGFLASFYSKVDIFILKKFFDNQTLGVYSAGLKFLDALLIIAGSYNIIVIPLMRKLAKNPRQLKTKIIKDMVFLFAFGVLVATSFYLAAPFLLSLVLKSNFSPSLQVARIVSFAIIPILLTSVFYNALYSLKKEKWVMIVLVIQSVISFVSYWFSIPYFGYWGAMYVKITLEFVNTTLSGIFLVYALKNQK